MGLFSLQKQMRKQGWVRIEELKHAEHMRDVFRQKHDEEFERRQSLDEEVVALAHTNDYLQAEKRNLERDLEEAQRVADDHRADAEALWDLKYASMHKDGATCGSPHCDNADCIGEAYEKMYADEVDPTCNLYDAWETVVKITDREQALHGGNDGPPETDLFLSDDEKLQREYAAHAISETLGVSPAFVLIEARDAVHRDGMQSGADGEPDMLAPPDWMEFQRKALKQYRSRIEFLEIEIKEGHEAALAASTAKWLEEQTQVHEHVAVFNRRDREEGMGL